MHISLHNDAMERTTIMADPEVLRALRALARSRGVSFAEVVREALEQKAKEHWVAPTCMGLGSSGRGDVSSIAGVGRTPPR